MDVHKKQRPFITEETLPAVDDALAFSTRAPQKPIACLTDTPIRLIQKGHEQPLQG